MRSIPATPFAPVPLLFLQAATESELVKGNVLWPTDSRLMVDLVGRLWRRGERLDVVGLSNIDEPRIAKVLGKMSLIDREISLGTGSKKPHKRRCLYRNLLKKARHAVELLTPQLELTTQALRDLNVLPSLKAFAARLVNWMQTDLENLRRVVQCCEARAIRDEKVSVSEKILSVSDPDVGFIAKGGRESVVGYKPQLARSGNGFIMGLIVPQGNASDSGQLVPMFEQVVGRTGVTPEIVSVDDGYSSIAGRETILALGAKAVSISGAKGKKITPDADWDSEEYAVARDKRSAVESLMFTIKNGFDFGRVARRGLENVRAELLEKVIAYNFCRMATYRHAKIIPKEAQAA
jgi:IS5 family transposase